MLSVHHAERRKQAHYAESRYAVCRYAEFRYAACRGAVQVTCFTHPTGSTMKTT